MDEKRVTISDILRAHWAGTKGVKGYFVGSVVGFALAAFASVFIPIQYKALFDGFSAGASEQALLYLLYAVIAITFVEWGAGRVGYFLINLFESRAMAQLAQQSLDVLLRHSYSFYQNNFAGSLVQRVRRFSGAFERLADTVIITLVPISISLIGAVVVVYQEKPELAYIMLVWVAVFIASNYYFSRFKLPYDLNRARLDSETTAVLSDVITNHNAVMLYTGAGKELSMFTDVTNRRAHAMQLSWGLGTLFDGAQSLVMIGITFVAFAVLIHYWAVGAVTLGTFVLVQVYLIQLSGRMWDLGRVVRHVYEAVADSREMVEIMRLPYEVTAPPDAPRLTVPAGQIAFSDVSFQYHTGRSALSGVSLTIPAGQKVALVGPSGAGKSTFVKLLLRLYDVTSGRIEIDGQNIASVQLDSLRSAVAFVPQEPVLFHRSLMDNIRYGRPDATDAEVREAARRAHCDEFIEVLPEKYETFVGERGVKLSGGERQRVAIARAILKNAPILVLDEATSSLDSHSESLIQDALNTLMEGKTVVVIAHRLSTIRKMDRILVIQDGTIVEDGSHDELVSRDTLYKSLWSLQAGGFIVEE